MRANEFLSEKQIPKSLDKLKKDVITQIQATDDPDLLDRIYTVLNKSGLSGRIAGVLTRDTDAGNFVNDITNLIIETPGTYKEKWDFINGFPNGYVNVEKMLSGEKVTFEDLLTGNDFVKKIFNALKQYSPAGVKGPGEFAMAVLSPRIKISGKGDFHIDNQVIEVKASAGAKKSSGGGRLGTPGLLRSDNIENILQKYFPKMNFDSAYIPLEGLNQLSSKLTPQQKKAFGSELFKYIFKQANTSKLISAFAAGQPLSSYYLAANWEEYQKSAGWNKLLLINFTAGILQSFNSPQELESNIYAISVYILSKDRGFQARQILSQVTLK